MVCAAAIAVAGLAGATPALACEAHQHQAAEAAAVAFNSDRRHVHGSARQLHDTGAYEVRGVVPTTSPSMDIQVSSNFERALFDVYDRDGGTQDRAEDHRRGEAALVPPVLQPSIDVLVCAAARALGQSNWKIITRHLLPNVMHLVFIKFVLGFSGLVRLLGQNP